MLSRPEPRIWKSLGLSAARRRPTERGHSCPQLPRWLSRGPQCSMPLAFPLHPEGMFDNSPTFQRWVRRFGGTQVPKGRLNPRTPSAVPSGLILLRALVPNVETLGYYRLSLRDKGMAGNVRPLAFGLPSDFGLRTSDFARSAQPISHDIFPFHGFPPRARAPLRGAGGLSDHAGRSRASGRPALPR